MYRENVGEVSCATSNLFALRRRWVAGVKFASNAALSVFMALMPSAEEGVYLDDRL